mmetsp:Transcript_5714/g.9001  ORF Transcript_5714/g.9001 Transcript_5714/m.9001 type:complete len:85 (+) Transcript_5714:298-552(+)
MPTNITSMKCHDSISNHGYIRRPSPWLRQNAMAPSSVGLIYFVRRISCSGQGFVLFFGMGASNKRPTELGSPWLTHRHGFDEMT